MSKYRIIDDDDPSVDYPFIYASYQLVGCDPTWLRQQLMNHSRRTGHEPVYTVTEAKEIYQRIHQANVQKFNQP